MELYIIYRSRPAGVAQSRHAFVGYTLSEHVGKMTDTRKQKANNNNKKKKKTSEMPIKRSLFVGNMQIG